MVAVARAGCWPLPRVYPGHSWPCSWWRSSSPGCLLHDGASPGSRSRRFRSCRYDRRRWRHRATGAPASYRPWQRSVAIPWPVGAGRPPERPPAPALTRRLRSRCGWFRIPGMAPSCCRPSSTVRSPSGRGSPNGGAAFPELPSAGGGSNRGCRLHHRSPTRCHVAKAASPECAWSAGWASSRTRGRGRARRVLGMAAGNSV